MPAPSIPPRAHEWISFEDPDEARTWMFDVTFLLSNWTCIFGAGCQGVLTGPAPELVQGCCSYGAHFVDEDDAAKIEELAKQLTPDEWQFHGRAKSRGILKRSKGGDITTRLADDACIFLNRPGFPTGPGCALHQAAVTRGERPLDWKPDVCWQLPLRREDETLEDGHVVSRVIQWDREHWGDGGDEFHWWCTESPQAFVGGKLVYEELKDELIEMCGAVPYQLVASYLDQRRHSTPLPHPALRSKR